MSFIYLVDDQGALFGPVSIPVTPGIGLQLPSNAVELAEELPAAQSGFSWVMHDESPEQVVDLRGTVYRKDSGEAVSYEQLGPLPDDLTSEPRPTPDHAWTDGRWTVDAALQAKNAEAVRDALLKQIDAERDKRISAGFDFNGVRYQSRLPKADQAGDWEVFSGKALEALVAIMGGAQPGDLTWSKAGEDFAWIAADNSRVPMDAQTVIELGKAASAHRSRHTFAGSDLKARSPIPSDYADDKWWP